MATEEKNKSTPVSRPGSLRNKIFRSSALAAILPLALSAALSIYLIRASHRSDIDSIMNNLVDQKTGEVDKFISDRLGALDLVLEVASDNPVSGLINVLAPGTKNEPGDQIALSQSGERIKYLVRSDSLANILSNSMAADPALQEIYLVDGPTGRVVSSQSSYPSFPDNANSFLYLGALPEVRAALRGDHYIGPSEPTLGGPMITLASPIRNQTGRILGAAVALVSLEDIRRTFDLTSLGSSGYVYLLDGNGYLVFRSRPASSPPSYPPKQNSYLASFLSSRVQSSSGVAVEYQSPWGADVLASARRVDKDFNWVLVAEWPKDDANRVVTNLSFEFSIAILLAAVLTLVLSIFLASRIVRPINLLAEAAKRVANGKLDQPVEIKTKDEIQELGEEFNSMQEGLKKLEELREEFVFIAAHELKTPVAATQGYISFIQDEKMAGGSLPPQAKTFFEQIVKANKRLVQLVEDLLQVARSEAGRLSIKVAPVDIAEPIRTVFSELKSLADQKEINLAYSPTPNPPLVLADSDRLKEILVNLVGNAIKYTPGAGQVSIIHETKGNQLITHVRDTGLGIAPEAQAKLFQKFYRVQTVETQKIQGTGLGLFIVKQIIEKMSGTIGVSSEPGKGSDFYFSLPLAPSLSLNSLPSPPTPASSV